jgi:hypothetical protein
MKVTAIIKNVNEYFFNGYGDSIVGLNNLDDVEKFNYLMNKGVSMPDSVTTKVGSNMFKDKVELNQLRRKPFDISYKLENRKGYKLATFEITPI